MMDAFQNYFQKWQQGGRQRLVDLLCKEARGNNAEKACVQNVFGLWRTYALDGDKIAKKCFPENPPKSPDIYAFQDGVEPPLHTIECKYDVRLQGALGKGKACAVRQYAEHIVEKFNHAEDFRRYAFSQSPSPKYVVFSHEVAPIAREEIESYLLEHNMELWKIGDTEFLCKELEKAGVQH